MAEPPAVVIRLVLHFAMRDFGFIGGERLGLFLVRIVEGPFDRRIHHGAGRFHDLDVILGLGRVAQLGIRQCANRFPIGQPPIESLAAHAGRRGQRGQALGRIGNHERRVFHAVKARADRFGDELFFGVAGVDVAADVDVRRHALLPRAQRARNGGADAGRPDTDRKQISGHHVILGLEVHRAELGFVRQAAHDRAVVHD